MKADYIRAKAEAIRLLDALNYTKPPIDPVEVADFCGVDVLFSDFLENDDISGFYDPLRNTIFVNRKEPPYRQIFTIAHELGHSILHSDWVKSNDYHYLYRKSLYSPEDPKEQEANYFAANLLVPEKILREYKNYATTDGLMRLFGVSRPVIAIRMKSEYGR